MRGRLSLWFAFAALAVRLLAPLAAYVSPTPGWGEICSAVGKASSAGKVPAGAPAGAHLLSHCTDCPCGVSELALPAVFVPPLLATTHAPATPTAAPSAQPATRALLPPPRGPPSIAPFV